MKVGFKYKILFKYKTWFKYKIWFKYENLGPYGPWPIWGRAHMGPGPLGPGPSLLGKHLTKKRTLEKRIQIVVFGCFLETKKMRNVRTIILAAVSRRDLCYVSENKGFRFAKNKLIHAELSFIAHRSRAHFCFMKFIPINVLIPHSKDLGAIQPQK